MSWLKCFLITFINLCELICRFIQRENFVTNLKFFNTIRCLDVRNSWKVFVCGAFNKFPDFFVQAFKIVVDS